MKLLTDEQIKTEIHHMRPNKIAVAYIGVDWAEFIDPTYIEQIIVSPRIGSNPVAIKALVRRMGGWEKVFFLEELHSKIYLKYDDPHHSVIIGSANLSKNALDAGGLIETCILTNDENTTAQANAVFDNYISVAKGQYGTDTDKENRLQKLFKSYPITSIGNEISINDFEYSEEKPIYVSFYISSYGQCDYDQIRVLCPELECLTDEEINFQIKDEHHFLSDDTLQAESWVLVYRLNQDLNFLGKNNVLQWFYIHELIPNGLKEPNSEYIYTQVAIQLRSRYVPEPPFVIDNKLMKAFRTILNSGGFNDFRPNRENVDSFSVNRNSDRISSFFDALREEYEYPTVS